MTRAELVAVIGDALEDALMCGDDLPTAALAAIEAAGCVVVPREATEDQRAAGLAYLRESRGVAGSAGIYRAMLAASPLAKEPGA